MDTYLELNPENSVWIQIEEKEVRIRTNRLCKNIFIVVIKHSKTWLSGDFVGHDNTD